MDEVADDPVLGFAERGTHTSVGIFPGQELTNNYGLNTVDLCPVGALTSNDFRFQMRTWFLKETESIDTNCGTGANIIIWTRGNKIFRITPRQNDEVNSCWLPDSHRLAYICPTDENRLTAPLIKVEGVHEEVNWETALDAAADDLKQFEPHEIAVIASGKQTNEELMMMKVLTAELRAQNMSIVARHESSDDMLISSDRNPNTTGAKLILQNNDPSSALSTILEGVRSGSIKALVSASENLLAEARLKAEDLDSLELLISVQAQTNGTAQASNIVLPGAAPAEKRGSMVNVTGRLQILQAACTPPGDAKSDWEIIRDLTLALSGEAASEAPQSIEKLFAIIAENIPEFADKKLTQVGNLGEPITETGITIPLVEKEREKKSNGEIVG